MYKNWIPAAGVLTGLLVGITIGVQKPLLASASQGTLSNSNNQRFETLLAQDSETEVQASFDGCDSEEVESPEVKRVADELMANLATLQEFVLQNPDVFEIRNPDFFENRAPAALIQLSTAVRALDDLRVMTCAFRSPESTAYGVSMFTALNNSLAAFPAFVRSSEFIVAYRQLDDNNKATVGSAIKEIAESLKIWRVFAALELGVEDVEPEEEVVVEEEVEVEVETIEPEMQDTQAEDKNWRN
jgi:hypothetical protein